VPQIPANILLVKNLTVMGLYWGGYLNFAPHILTGSLARIFDWLAAGNLHPHISHTVDFADYPAALDLLRRRASAGKVVVTLP
jgi:NADPH2:quinone reductase